MTVQGSPPPLPPSLLGMTKDYSSLERALAATRLRRQKLIAASRNRRDTIYRIRSMSNDVLFPFLFLRVSGSDERKKANRRG